MGMQIRVIDISKSMSYLQLTHCFHQRAISNIKEMQSFLNRKAAHTFCYVRRNRHYRTLQLISQAVLLFLWKAI